MMKLILLIVGLVLLMGTASATSTYDVATNTITVTNGVNYPWTVYSDVSNTTAFNRTGNESIMTADMTLSSGATLYINDETWKFNCSSDNEYYIKVIGKISIDNSTITVTNTSYQAKGILTDDDLGHQGFNITNSVITYLGYNLHGIYIRGGNGANFSYNDISHCNEMHLKYTSNSIVHNNNMHDMIGGQGIDCADTNMSICNNRIYNISFAGAVGIQLMGTGSIISNNTIYNVTSGGILTYESSSLTVTNNTVYDCGDGIQASYLSWAPYVSGNTILNNVVYDCFNGILFDAYHNTGIVENNIVYDCTVALRYGQGLNHSFKNNVWRDSSVGILFYVADNSTFINESIYNCSSKGIDYKNHVSNQSIILRDTYFNNNTIDVDFYTNTKGKLNFINTPISSSSFDNANNSILMYYYKDVSVTDISLIGIDGATVTFENSINPSYPSVDINLTNQSSYSTGSDGHTDLPNETISVVLLDYRQYLSGTEHMEWNISADAAEYNANSSAITNLNITSGYYRSDSDVYQNTSIVTLSGWSFDSDKTYENVKYRYYTDGTRTIIGRNPLETDSVVFTDNSSWPVPS